MISRQALIVFVEHRTMTYEYESFFCELRTYSIVTCLCLHTLCLCCQGDDDEGGFHLGAQARGGNAGPGFALKF